MQISERGVGPSRRTERDQSGPSEKKGLTNCGGHFGDIFHFLNVCVFQTRNSTNQPTADAVVSPTLLLCSFIAAVSLFWQGLTKYK